MTGGTIPPASTDGDLMYVVSTPWGVENRAIRRAYEDLQQQLADNLASLWDWSPPWSPSPEVLVEIRRQAGAPVERHGWTLEASNIEADDVDPPRDLTASEAMLEWMLEWMRSYLDLELVDWQRELFESAFGPQSVDTRGVSAGFRRVYLNSPVKRKRGR